MWFTPMRPSTSKFGIMCWNGFYKFEARYLQNPVGAREFILGTTKEVEVIYHQFGNELLPVSGQGGTYGQTLVDEIGPNFCWNLKHCSTQMPTAVSFILGLHINKYPSTTHIPRMTLGLIVVPELWHSKNVLLVIVINVLVNGHVSSNFQLDIL